MVKKIVVTCGIRPVPVNFIESHCHPKKCHCTTHFYRFVQEKLLFVIRKVSFYTFYTDNNIYVEWITVIYNSDCANRLQAINANSSISKKFLIKFLQKRDKYTTELNKVIKISVKEADVKAQQFKIKCCVHVTGITQRMQKDVSFYIFGVLLTGISWSPFRILHSQIYVFHRHQLLKYIIPSIALTFLF